MICYLARRQDAVFILAVIMLLLKDALRNSVRTKLVYNPSRKILALCQLKIGGGGGEYCAPVYAPNW